MLPLFDTQAGGVDEKHIVIVAMLLQHHDNCRDAGAEENVCGETYDGVNLVFLYEIPADHRLRLLLLVFPAKQNAVRKHDCHDAIRLDMVKVMQ